jgi:hypothetical protein
VHKGAAQEVERVVVVEEGAEGEVQEVRKAKEMTNLLGIAAVAEIGMELGGRLIGVVVVLFLILIRQQAEIDNFRRGPLRLNQR